MVISCNKHKLNQYIIQLHLQLESNQKGTRSSFTYQFQHKTYQVPHGNKSELVYELTVHIMLYSCFRTRMLRHCYKGYISKRVHVSMNL